MKTEFVRACLVSVIIVVLMCISQKSIQKDKLVLSVYEKKLDIRLFFGYKDARPARFVADRYEAAMAFQKLTDPCVDARADCGFTTTFQIKAGGPQTHVFHKVMIAQDGKRILVSLRIFTSSVGADDNENRLNPYQKWKSDYIKDQFSQALASADVVLYNGHSRSGGGPDFSVPELTKSKHVNYALYQKRRLGLSLMQTTLKKSPTAPLKVVGLYSCQSDQLFRKKIQTVRPKLKVVGSRQLLYFSDAFNDSLDQLSQMLGTI